jgi:hypothetical protein
VQETVKQDEEASTASTQLAINLSFALNVALVVLKMIALVISGTHLSMCLYYVEEQGSWHRSRLGQVEGRL